MKYIFDKFYSGLTLEDCFNIHIYAQANPDVFPKDFLLKLIKFMLDKKLKNYDYNKFIDYVYSLGSHKFTSINSKKMVRLFGIFPVMKIQQKGNKKKYKLFGFIPLLTIK